MAEKSTRTKMLEEAEIKDDPLMLKRALRGAGVGISKLADKAGFTQEEEYKKMEESKKKRAGGSIREESLMRKKGRGNAKAMMQKEATKAVRKHEKAMHGMKEGGSVSKRADGCAVRGKTRGRMV